MTHKNNRVLSVSELARVEGEGAMYVRASDGKVEEVRLEIYEPPRFFEAFLRGRAYTEPPDITARICGICPVAYQMSACQAIEDACGVTVDGPIADLRRLLYCGEWIESHALHIYLLHAPDFLGYSSAIEMATHGRDIVQRGLAMKKAGNAIMERGRRPGHPPDQRPGRRLLPGSRPGRARLAHRSAEPGARGRPGHRAVGVRVRLPRFRVRGGHARAVPARQLRDRAGHRGDALGPGLPRRRLGRARDRRARAALQRAARSPGGRPPLPHRAAGQVLAQLTVAFAAGP